MRQVDTPIADLVFRPWSAMFGEIPPLLARAIARNPLLIRYADAKKCVDGDGAVFAVARLLGTDYLLAAMPVDGSNSGWLPLVSWGGRTHALDACGTRQTAIEQLLSYASATLDDPVSVLSRLGEADDEFISQAMRAGATVSFEGGDTVRIWPPAGSGDGPVASAHVSDAFPITWRVWLPADCGQFATPTSDGATWEAGNGYDLLAMREVARRAPVDRDQFVSAIPRCLRGRYGNTSHLALACGDEMDIGTGKALG